MCLWRLFLKDLELLGQWQTNATRLLAKLNQLKLFSQHHPKLNLKPLLQLNQFSLSSLTRHLFICQRTNQRIKLGPVQCLVAQSISNGSA